MLEPSVSLSNQPVGPADPALPGGDGAVDRGHLVRLIDRLVPGGGGDGPRHRTDPDTIRFEAIRYKPGVRLIVSLSVPGPDGERRRYTVHAFRRTESEPALGKLRDEGTPDDAIGHDAGREILIIRFPWDHELPGLRRVVPGRPGASYIRRLIPGLGSPESRLRSRSFAPSLLRYKPERHAVYRLDFEIREKPTGERRAEALVARVFPPQEPPFMSGASLGGVTPRTLAYDPHRGVALEERLDGMSLGDTLGDSRSSRKREAVLRQVGAAVAALHLDDSDDARGDHQPHPAGWPGGTLRSAERLHRRLSVPVADAFARLAASVATIIDLPATGEPVRGHGDLHVNQILWSEHRIGLVDIEKSMRTEPEMDLGMLVSSVQEMLAGEGRASDVLAPLIGGYVNAGGREPDPTRLRAWAAWVALIRSTAPLRNLHPERDAMVATHVRRAEETLAGVVPLANTHPKT